jgi:hypothetical protein
MIGIPRGNPATLWLAANSTAPISVRARAECYREFGEKTRIHSAYLVTDGLLAAPKVGVGRTRQFDRDQANGRNWREAADGL